MLTTEAVTKARVSNSAHDARRQSQSDRESSMSGQSTATIEFQELLIKLLDIPAELSDKVIEIDIHSDCRNQPTATIKYEIFRNDALETAIEKYAITDNPEEEP